MFYNKDNRNYEMSDLCSYTVLPFFTFKYFLQLTTFSLSCYVKNLHVILHIVRKNYVTHENSITIYLIY